MWYIIFLFVLVAVGVFFLGYYIGKDEVKTEVLIAVGNVFADDASNLTPNERYYRFKARREIFNKLDDILGLKRKVV
jgi:hypothetical protein